MSINAQLAQGTKLYIEGAGTAPATITAIAKAFRAEITATHAFEKGDRVTFAGVTGMTEINGLTATVVDVTGTTKFCVDIDSRAFTTYTSGGTATGFAWTQIKEIKSIKPSGSSSSKIDVTDLDSTAKEYRSGLMDNGTFSADLHILESDPGQAAALAAFAASTVNTYKLVSPAKTRTFRATCTKFPTMPDSSVDGVQTGSAEWQISGDITVS